MTQSNELTGDCPALETSTFGGASLSWRSAGQRQAPTLVLLHGISSGSASWVRQFADRELTKRVHLLAWDAPGYGGSTALRKEQPLADDYAKVLFDWLMAMQITRPVLLGHSLGALIASAFVCRYPQKVAGLILADPAEGYATHNLSKRTEVYDIRVEQMRNGLGEAVSERASRLLKPNASQENLEIVQSVMRHLNPQGYLSAAWMLANDDIHRGLPFYRGACEVWCGEQDIITPSQKAAQLAETYRAKFRPIANAGHAAYLDNAVCFNQLITRFISQIDVATEVGVKE